jgi:hypothetical protein
MRNTLSRTRPAGLMAGLFACAALAACADGKSATVANEPAGVNCAKGGVKVQVGDGTPSYVCNGADGTSGTNGTGGLSATVTPEDPGANCAEGGVKVQVGTAAATYVCNSAAGVDGQSATVTPEPSGANCAKGGLKVQVGTGAATYVCNGADGADGQSAAVTAEPPGANCVNGGVKVQVGAGTPSYVCAAGATKYYVFVVAHFASAVVADNKTGHDAIVSANRGAVTADGDEKHLAFLGMAGTNPADPNWGQRNFLGIDVWNDFAGLNRFLTNPAVGAAFATLFDAQPAILVTEAPAGFSRWGALEPKAQDVAAPPNPFTYAVLVRGTLKGATAGGRQAAHNQVADGGKAAASSLGDYGHFPCLDMANDTHFVNIDLWDNAVGMNAFLSDPQVGQAFAGLFDMTDATNPLSFGVYTTCDFAQY